MKKITAKESLFCRFYVSGRNSREAAYKAGYTVCPELTAKKLLAQNRIIKEIERLEKEVTASAAEVRAGLRRLAFSSSADAVRLLLSENWEGIEIEALDLFNVAEIKRPKAGGLEIKFFDRIKALEKLSSLSEMTEDTQAKPFYEALEKSAAALNGGHE